jgi:DNA-binding Lrp family transcriptional regulator
MIEAYILVQTEVGRSGAIGRQLSGLEGIASSRPVTGPYDVVVLAQVDELPELAKLVDTGIQAVDGVTRTMTCVVHE